MTTPYQASDLTMRGLFSPRALLARAVLTGGLITLASWRMFTGHGALRAPAIHLHWPHLSLLARVSPVIQLHIAAALTAVVVGSVLLAGVKGSARHRQLGWTWVIAMGVTAISSLFIRVINPGHWSFIHFASGWVIIALPMAVVAIRRRNIRLHRRLMTGVFIGGLVIAGAFTFAPGRLMYAVFLG